MTMKKWILMLPGMLLCSVIFAASQTSNANKTASTSCDSHKIQACMKGCVKKINPNSTSISASSPLTKCVDTCSAQGCQVANK